MSPRFKTTRRVLKAFLPIVLVVVVAIAGVMAWLVYGITRPPRRPYLVTPQTFAQVTGPILNARDEAWTNRDGTLARGWLIRGAEGSPAVILMHRYGTDRSWLLNFAVKLNETTNFTVLWPDLRGHGQNPVVSWTLFGVVEGDDVAAAVDYLRSLKTPAGKPQVGGQIGMYGVEMGAYAALAAAARDPALRVLALDSVPGSPDEVVSGAVNSKTSTNNRVFQRLGLWGVKLYSLGNYRATPSCEFASSLSNGRVLLLTGESTDALRTSTAALASCFPRNSSVEVRKDLPLTGFNLPAATGQQEEGYDRPVIDFFDKALR